MTSTYLLASEPRGPLPNRLALSSSSEPHGPPYSLHQNHVDLYLSTELRGLPLYGCSA